MKKKYSKTRVAAQSLVGGWVLKFIYNTNVWDVRGEEQYKSILKDGGSALVSCWHGNLLATFMNLANNKYHGLAGTHKDAEIVARIAKKLGWRVLRGSSSEGGAEIFDEMLKILSQGSSLIALTPDGPKGPEKIPKPGIIRAAQKTGACIIPTASCSTKNWEIVNWHTFYLEKPFGKIFIEYGNPIFFDKSEDFEKCKEKLIEGMAETEKRNTDYAKTITT